MLKFTWLESNWSSTWKINPIEVAKYKVNIPGLEKSFWSINWWTPQRVLAENPYVVFQALINFLDMCYLPEKVENGN